MRSFCLGSILFMVGCAGPKPDDHFTKTAFPAGETMVAKYFRPAGKLTWSELKRENLTRDTHVVGAPVSLGNGERLYREASVGTLTYRIQCDYSNQKLLSVSVRNGERFEQSAGTTKAAAAFGVEPGLAKALTTQSNIVRYDGAEFLVVEDSFRLPGDPNAARMETTLVGYKAL